MQSGALWKDIIEYLDGAAGLPAIMQSNNSFTGRRLDQRELSWLAVRPSSHCLDRGVPATDAVGRLNSPAAVAQENPELFSLVLGGYGLFGVILDVDLYVVANQRYRM